MRVAFDSSAIFKRYSPEAGRDRVLAALAGATAVIVAPHLRLEVITSARRLVRDGLLDQDGYQHFGRLFQADLAGWEVQPYSRPMEEASLRAVDAARVRATDALHVGAALVARVQLFVTADRRQAEAARALHLETELVPAL